MHPRLHCRSTTGIFECSSGHRTLVDVGFDRCPSDVRYRGLSCEMMWTPNDSCGRDCCLTQCIINQALCARRVALGNFTPRPSQVGSGTGAPTVGFGGDSAAFAHGPQSNSHSHVSSPRLAKPGMRVFPHRAFLLISPQGLWDLLCWERVRQPRRHAVTRKQTEWAIYPLSTPPRSAKTLTLTRAH